MFGYNIYTLEHPNSKIHFFTGKKKCHILLHLHAKCLHYRHINSQYQLQNMLLTQGCQHSQHQLQLRFFIHAHSQNAFPHCAWHFVSCNTQHSLQAYKMLNLGLSNTQIKNFTSNVIVRAVSIIPCWKFIIMYWNYRIRITFPEQIWPLCSAA